MKLIDITEVLKNKFKDKKIKHKPTGIEAYDGMIYRVDGGAGPATTHLLEFGFEELEFVDSEIFYHEMKESDIPKNIITRRWILENYTDNPDKKNLTLNLNFTESVTAATSSSITKGKSSIFKADVSFNIGLVGKASTSFTETLTLSVQNTEAKTIVKSNVQSETYDFSYEVPPKKAAIINLSKEMTTYEIPFKAKFVLDGYIYFTSTNLTKHHITKQDAKAYGKISEYLTEEERTIEVEGKIGEIVGEVTRRSIKIEPLIDIESTINSVNFLSKSFSLLSETQNVSSEMATIRLFSLNSYENGVFDASFQIDTSLCEYSSCGTFGATLIIDDGEIETTELYHFEGWNVADSGQTSFIISRNGSINRGIVKDITNIENPNISCHD